MGADGVDRSGERFVHDHVMNRADDVVQRDPAHVLPAIAQPAARPHAKGRQHFGQGSAGRTEDDAGPQAEDANAGIGGRRRGGLPLAADFGQKSFAGATGFVELFVASIAIETDGRSADPNERPRIERSQRAREQRGAFDAAVENPLLLSPRPAAGGDPFACQVDHRLAAGQPLDIDLAGGRIPRNVVRRWWARAYQSVDLVPTGGEKRGQSRTDQSRRTRDGNPHALYS